jgi:hypothetical protein
MRPTVSPELVARLIEATPDRVRRRLDRAPETAASWKWEVQGETLSVDTGGETVTLPKTHVDCLEQLRCTCLLSPRCFHVLACLSSLEVAVVESAETTKEEPEPAPSGEAADAIELDDNQRHAAGEMTGAVSQLLRVGVAGAGVVVQSGLLRAIHQCRAEGLHRLAALGLRVIAGAGEFRSRAQASDPPQLAEDLIDLLETSRWLMSCKSVASFWVGAARRKQLPIRPRKLHGLFAEPVLTRSGFSGAAVYFLGEDQRIYSVSDVRPGDAQHARDAYLGGIEMGPLVQPARQLARGRYLGTDLTASEDGRLGRGKSVKIVEEGQSSWQVEAIQQRFGQPLADQISAVYAQTSSPADARPGSWDFVYFAGVVLGALGPELLFQPDSPGSPVRLAIANESETLCFRENLRMLSHAPGLRLQVIARINLQEPALVFPLAISEAASASQKGDEPRLEIPEALAGRICLGFDEIQRPWLRNARPAPVVLGSPHMLPERDDPLAALRRRWLAALLAGMAAQRPSNANTMTAETASLSRLGFSTGAALLDSLSRPPSDGGPAATDAFLAIGVYLRRCGSELAKLAACSAS